MINFNIRAEEENDFAIVENIVRDSFWDQNVPGCDEHYLLHNMRHHPEFVKELDFVVEFDNKLIAQIAFMKSKCYNISRNIFRKYKSLLEMVS